ncbi:MAG TPA: hypothetical protein VK639_20780 [Terriglobales bacterium]|nr:hypothetical protein [Terriglobales bacterium]
MAKKKKPKPFTAVEAVKTMAREQIGAPPGLRVVPDRKKKKKRTQKHKPTLGKFLAED